MSRPRRWSRLARQAGVRLARAHATLGDFRMWHASAQRYAPDFRVRPPPALALDSAARWFARWLPWWPA
jgi:hypothetical protein